MPYAMHLKEDADGKGRERKREGRK